MVSFFLLNLDILPYGGSDNSPAAPPATRLTHGVEVARFFKHTFFAAWHSFDTSTAASLATRLTHGIEVARFSTQSSAALSQHRHAPSDVLQRPRPTIGVKSSPLLALILQPQSDFNIPTAAFSATTNDARRENGSLLFKPTPRVSCYDTSSTHPKRCLQRPRPTNGVNGSQLLSFFFTSRKSHNSFPGSTHFQSCPSRYTLESECTTINTRCGQQCPSPPRQQKMTPTRPPTKRTSQATPLATEARPK
jgi:hypothetical protein